MKVQKEGRRIEQRGGGARRSMALLSVAAVMLFVTIFGYVVYVNFQRLGDLDRLAAKQNGLPSPDASTGGSVNPPTALAAAQPMEVVTPPANLEVVAAKPAAVAAPMPPKIYPRGTTQGLRNNVIHSPNQPRPDLLQP